MLEGLLMDGKPAWTTEAGVDAQLGELAIRARQVIVLIDGFSQPTLAALDAVGWNSGKNFALRAELARAVECADRAKLGMRGTVPASAR
jgi:hypothetical protein